MAHFGHWLHFSYGDMLEMELKTFLMFGKELETIVKQSNNEI